MAKVIMIQGTMSNAGKSLITAGLCRIFRQDGYKTAPFKSQNMALNSYITKEGLEMGRAQVVQAEAAKTEPLAAMNPILLKPVTDTGSQVIVNGISAGTMKAKEYFAYKKQLIPEIKKAFDFLDKKFDIIVIEGAGSPAEINLKNDDIVNMGMAKLAGAPVLLVGDIDRGGVFAQLYGTVMLLEPDERSMIKGLIINKFRGDKSILDSGTDMIAELCSIPVTGVVPYMDVMIEDEDSLSSKLSDNKIKKLIDIVVIHFPRISNFTDFDVFLRIPYISVRYVKRADELGTPDMVILPGTKNTISDLLWMRQAGIEAAVLKLAYRDIPVFGICGGYQMLGETLRDEKGVEGTVNNEVRGMGLLSMKTEFEEEKTRTLVNGKFINVEGIFNRLSGLDISGYEIHMGCSYSNSDHDEGLLKLNEYQNSVDIGKTEGRQNKNIYGTYVHGIFDGRGVAETIGNILLNKKGYDEQMEEGMDYRAFRENQYDMLAAELRKHLDLKEIYSILEKGLEDDI